MSTVDKLNRILETKEDLMDAINEKGGNIQETTLFKDYAQAITDLPIIKSRVQSETKCRDIVINTQNHIKAKLQDTLNFDITGSLNNTDGIFRGFSYDNFINNVYYTNKQHVVLRFKVRTYDVLSEQNIVHCEYAYNFNIYNKHFEAYSWQAGHTSVSDVEVPANTWLYLTLKFTRQDSNVLKQYYYSLDGFTTNESNKLFEFTDNLYTGSTSYYGGCIGLSSYSRGGAWLGEIDMSETNVVSHYGSIIRSYFTAGRELYSE